MKALHYHLRMTVHTTDNCTQCNYIRSGYYIVVVFLTELSMALECLKCENDVYSDQDNKAYCLTIVEDGAVPTETCADGVTNCYVSCMFDIKGPRTLYGWSTAAF